MSSLFIVGLKVILIKIMSVAQATIQHNFCPIKEVPQKIFIRSPNIKFHVNPSSGSGADIVGRMTNRHTGRQVDRQRDRQTDR